MKNRMKGLRRGFTLLETVITVGIVVALLAISGIGVASYMRSMKQLELDGIAKEIFLAAQNNLSVAYAQNYAGAETAVSKADGEVKLLPVSDPTVTADPYDVYYFIVGDGDDYKQLDDTDASLLGRFCRWVPSTRACGEAAVTSSAIRNPPDACSMCSIRSTTGRDLVIRSTKMTT